MRKIVTLGTVLLLTLPLRATTLKELLTARHIPLQSFGAEQLASNVTSIVLGSTEHEEIAYTFSKKAPSQAVINVLTFERKTGKLLHAVLPTNQNSVCSGPLVGLAETGDYLLVITDISPSAQCLHVLNSRLQQTQTLYGFAPTEVGKDQVVLTENMIHFASVHPERLQLADLRTGTTVELYPPKGDALRARLARENAKSMPPANVCARMNDPCDPQLFDETILAIAADDQRDKFAFVVRQSASHLLAPGKETATVSQSVLYIYRLSTHGWLYCENLLSDADAAALAPTWQSLQFNDVRGRCIPASAVTPDLSTAVMNPFFSK